MNLPSKVIDLPSFDPERNLAWERIFLKTGLPAALLWRSFPAVIIGRHQIRENEVDEAAIAGHHIRVVRRITGGGAVYIDPGNLNIGIISPAEAPQMPRWTALFSRILRDTGVAATPERNDILVDGRKVSGWAETLANGFSLAHGTLMFDVDIDILAAALRPPSEKLARHGLASVRRRVANLKEFLPDCSMRDFMRAVKRGLTE